MTVRDQVSNIRSNISVSNHRFFNMIVNGVKNKLQEDIPELDLKVSAAGLHKDGGTIVITGRAPASDDIDTKVRQTIDGLKNPADLLSTLE